MCLVTNEEPVLPYLSNTLLHFASQAADRYRLHYVFVDDGSQDHTWKLLQEIFGDWSNCQLLRHESNKGVTAATMTGVAHATTETVCVMDCDCTYDPTQFFTMLGMLTDDVAMVTASPYHSRGEVRNVPNWRLFLSRGASFSIGAFYTTSWPHIPVVSAYTGVTQSSD